MREPTNITVNRLDLTELFSQAKNRKIATDAEKCTSDDEKGSVELLRVSAVAEVAYVCCDDKLFVLTNDGCGHEVTESQPFWLSLYGEFRDKNDPIQKRIVRKLYGVNLTPNQILGTSVLDEQELGQFIRTFGSRLERNFELWRKTLQPYFPLTGEEK